MALPARAVAITMTVEEFLASSVPDGKAELVRGELRVTPPPGALHGVAGSNLVFTPTTHVRRHVLGRVFGDSFGYELVRLPRTVRVPDGSFVRAERLPPDGVGPGPGLLKFAPDLAIEVLSPHRAKVPPSWRKSSTITCSREHSSFGSLTRFAEPS